MIKHSIKGISIFNWALLLKSYHYDSLEDRSLDDYEPMVANRNYWDGYVVSDLPNCYCKNYRIATKNRYLDNFVKSLAILFCYLCDQLSGNSTNPLNFFPFNVIPEFQTTLRIILPSIYAYQDSRTYLIQHLKINSSGFY